MSDLQLKKLHPETIYVDPSLRSVSKSAESLSEYGFNLVVRGVIKFLKKRGQEPKTYSDLEKMINDNVEDLLAEIRAAIPDEIFKEYPDLTDLLLQMLFADNIFMESILTVAAYSLDTNRQNYYVNREFWSEFREVSLSSLRFRDLYRGSGYIHFPTPIEDGDGTKYPHYYFISGKIEDYFKVEQHRIREGQPLSDELLLITLLSEGDARRTLGVQIPENQDLKLSEYFENYVEHTFNMNGLKEETRKSYDQFSNELLNILAYIASGQPDIRSFRNIIEYRGNSSTPTNSCRDLSALDINLIGFNWKKERLLNAEGWGVKSHLRWQRCGRELQEVKLITVPAHEKQWRNTHTTESDTLSSDRDCPA